MRRNEECSVCRRVTSHKVTQNRSESGKRSTETLTCEAHRNLPDGQLDIRDPRTGRVDHGAASQRQSIAVGKVRWNPESAIIQPNYWIAELLRAGGLCAG